MSLCQEDSQKDKAINVKKDQDQEPFHLFQEVTLPYLMSYTPPNYDEDITITILIGITKNHEKIYMPILSKENCQDQIVPLCYTFPYPPKTMLNLQVLLSKVFLQ